MPRASGVAARSPQGQAQHVERQVTSTRPVAITYRITPLGKTLRNPVDVLLAWASEHMPAIERARDAFDAHEDAAS